MTTLNRHVSEEATSEWLIQLLIDVTTQEEALRQRRYLLEAELQARMEAEGATEIPHETHRVRLVSDTPNYDMGIIVALRELLTDTDLHAACTPAHTKEISVPEKWNGTRLNSYELRYGGQVAKVIQQARIPGRSRVQIQAKDKP